MSYTLRSGVVSDPVMSRVARRCRRGGLARCMNCGETGHQQEDVATWTSFMAGLNRGAQAPLRPGGTRLVGEQRTRRLCRLRVHRPPDRRSLASSLHGRNRRRAMARDLVKWSRVLRREISVSRRHAQRIERADQTFIEAHGPT